MKLSILTPTIPGREQQAQLLSEKLNKQIQGREVEHLIFSDNRTRSIGEKRQALVDIANGEYIAFVDDDDDVAESYVSDIMHAIGQAPDVITFCQRATYNRQTSHVIFRLGQADGAFQPGGTTKRGAWHVCAWRRALVRDCQFLSNNYGEDLAWCLQARERVRTELHIGKVLHYYRHDAATTAAPES